MNISSNNDTLYIMGAIIYFIAGICSIVSGIFALAKINIKIPGWHQLGVFISELLFGKDKTSNFEEEMMDASKVVRYSILWILIGLVGVAGGVFLLFVK